MQGNFIQSYAMLMLRKLILANASAKRYIEAQKSWNDSYPPPTVVPRAAAAYGRQLKRVFPVEIDFSK